MNQTTEQPMTQHEPRREFSQGFILILVALTLATLIMVFLFERGGWRSADVRQYLGSWNFRMFGSLLFPWLAAAAQTLNNGLQEFSGHVPESVAFGPRIAFLIGLLVSGVIGPTLFFLGWRERVKQGVGGKQKVWQASTLAFVFGGMLTFLVAIPSVPVSIGRMISESKMREAQAIQSNRDMIINDLNFLAYNARQYRILPKAMEGGNGSYFGYVLSADLASTPHASYSLTSVEPARIKVLARSSPYPNCTVSVEINEYGALSFWTYTGDFQ